LPNGVGVAQFVADVGAQRAADVAIVPRAAADEQLQGAAFLAGLVGDGFGGLALQSAELAAAGGAGGAALLGAGEVGQVAGQVGFQGGGAGADGVRAEVGVVEQGLGIGVFEQVHDGPPRRATCYCNTATRRKLDNLAQ